MYEITLDSLKSANNERLWFNTNLKLAKVYLENSRYSDAERLLTDLKLSCQKPDGSEDPSKSTNLVEVYCLEIRLCTATSDRARMKEVYPKTLNLRNAISHPRIMGLIREEGGKMYMADGNWSDAYNELFASFLAYQEAGDTRAKSCLKYLVLASMLALSKINPFAAKEANVYAEDREILAMSELRQCLEATDLPRFERILADKRNRITDEPFLMTYIGPLRKRMREKVYLSILFLFRF
jgi:COP9 signalosome complex subunit 2